MSGKIVNFAQNTQNPILIMTTIERNLTDYVPNCQRELNNYVANNIKNTSEYRKWLQMNGNNIMLSKLQSLESNLYM